MTTRIDRLPPHDKEAEEAVREPYEPYDGYFLQAEYKTWLKAENQPEWMFNVWCRHVIPGLCLWCRQANPRKALCCCPICTRAFSENHNWSYAVPAALRKAHFCCQDCGVPWKMVDHRLEVHHIHPLDGGPRAFTCRNHQDNLLALCHDCHIKGRHGRVVSVVPPKRGLVLAEQGTLL